MWNFTPLDDWIRIVFWKVLKWFFGDRFFNKSIKQTARSTIFGIFRFSVISYVKKGVNNYCFWITIKSKFRLRFGVIYRDNRNCWPHTKIWCPGFAQSQNKRVIGEGGEKQPLKLIFDCCGRFDHWFCRRSTMFNLITHRFLGSNGKPTSQWRQFPNLFMGRP